MRPGQGSAGSILMSLCISFRLCPKCRDTRLGWLLDLMPGSTFSSYSPYMLIKVYPPLPPMQPQRAPLTSLTAGYFFLASLESRLRSLRRVCTRCRSTWPSSRRGDPPPPLAIFVYEDNPVIRNVINRLR